MKIVPILLLLVAPALAQTPPTPPGGDPPPPPSHQEFLQLMMDAMDACIEMRDIIHEVSDFNEAQLFTYDTVLEYQAFHPEGSYYRDCLDNYQEAWVNMLYGNMGDPGQLARYQNGLSDMSQGIVLYVAYPANPQVGYDKFVQGFMACMGVHGTLQSKFVAMQMSFGPDPTLNTWAYGNSNEFRIRLEPELLPEWNIVVGEMPDPGPGGIN